MSLRGFLWFLQMALATGASGCSSVTEASDLDGGADATSSTDASDLDGGADSSSSTDAGDFEGGADATSSTDATADAPVGTRNTCPGELLSLGGDPPSVSVADDLRRHVDTFSPFNPMCPPGGNDAVFRVNSRVDGVLELTMTPTGFDGILSVRTVCNDNTSEEICVDSGSVQDAEHLVTAITANRDYFIIAEAYDTDQSGPYRLDVTVSP